MEPGFSDRSFAFLVLSISALNSIKLILGPVNLIFTKELISSCDNTGDRGQVLSFDTWSFRYELTLEYAIDTDASIMTERNRFRPRVAALEEYVFKIGANEGILDWVTIVVKGLTHIFIPTFIQ